MSRDTRPCMLIYIQSAFVSLWNKEKKRKEKEIQTKVYAFNIFLEKFLSIFFTLYAFIRLEKAYFAPLR